MSLQAYCLVDGVDGEAVEEGHKGWIKLVSFGHSVSQRHNMGSGSALKGQGAGFGTFNLVKEIDKSSVDLNKLCALGSKVKEIKVDVCSDVEGVKPKMSYILKNVIVAHVGVSGGSDGLNENVQLAFGEIHWHYTSYKADGNTKDTEHKSAWDVAKKKVI